MKKENKPNQGWSIHCHHDILAEWCYDYKERVEVIKREKPKNEIKTRLKLFKLLPEEASKDIPKEYQETYQKWQEAYQKWQEAYQKRREAEQKRREAYQKWRETDQKWEEADQKWPQKSKDAFHKKWCGCKEWNGKQIVFKP